MSLTLTERFAADAQAVLEPLDLDQYYRMLEAGVIAEGAPIELIDGLLIRKDRRDSEGDIMTIGTRHSSTIRRLLILLQPFAPQGVLLVQSQQPIHVSDYNAPEPDVSVLLGGVDDYSDHHPTPSEIALVVEVADSSLDFELGRKQELYRDAGVPEYWVVNLRDRCVEVFRGPQSEGWREHTGLTVDQLLETTLAGVPISLVVRDVLPG